MLIFPAQCTLRLQLANSNFEQNFKFMVILQNVTWAVVSSSIHVIFDCFMLILSKNNDSDTLHLENKLYSNKVNFA